MDLVISQAAIRTFHRRLHDWYGRHGRKDLPWRNTRDPYAIYVSEVMLQQTQVATVLGRYYFPFLKRFPTLASLAAAREQDVLSVWQGLGYYNRAINLHNAAKQCSGALPQQVDDILALPGIGRNTAHAVASFAYHHPVPVMEANVRRVLARIFALRRPSEAELWDKAHALLDSANPFDYNQAMMDIGALVCSKRTPRCGECPAERLCRGKAAPASYPAAKVKKQVPVRKKHILVKENGAGRYYAVPRPGKFLRGLYHFLESEAKPTGAHYLGHIRQQYSHFTLEAEVWLMSGVSATGKDWHTLSQLETLPLSMAEKKILALFKSFDAKKAPVPLLKTVKVNT